MKPDTASRTFQALMNGFTLAYGKPHGTARGRWGQEVAGPTFLENTMFYFTIQNSSSGWSADYRFDSGQLSARDTSRWERGGPGVLWQSFVTNFPRTLDDFDSARCSIQGKPDNDWSNQDIEERTKEGLPTEKMWCWLDMTPTLKDGRPAYIQMHFQSDHFINFRFTANGVLTLTKKTPP